MHSHRSVVIADDLAAMKRKAGAEEPKATLPQKKLSILLDTRTREEQYHLEVSPF
jgi:hypothetical protein